jgi:predicted dienelactone hydrolase
MFKSRLVRRVFKAIAILALLGVLGIAALFGALWLEHRTEVSLPTPTGSFSVGRATYVWTDEAHPDTSAPDPKTKRELFVWIWYPSQPAQSTPDQSATTKADYMPAEWRAAFQRRGGPLINLITRDLSLVHGHSLRNADVAPQERSYPVVIMRGGASSEVVNYSTLAEDLASHGYVVVGFDAPYRTGIVAFPDGRVITRLPENNPELFSGQDFDRVGSKLLAAWTADIGFVLDQLERLNASDPSGKFTGKLDMTRVGVFGHSFGGAQAAQFCHEDSRCKAAIDVDGLPLGSVIQAGIDRPFMFLLSDHSRESGPESREVKANIQSIYDRLPPDARALIVIRGANHFLFSDDGALLKSHIVLRTLRLLGIVGIDGRRQLAITAYCVHTFFDACLKGTGVSPLKIASPLYPEIEVPEMPVPEIQVPEMPSSKRNP